MITHSFPSPTALWRNIFLLVLTALIKVLFTAWSFGMMVGHFIGDFFVPHRNVADPCWNFLTHDCDWCLPREGNGAHHVSKKEGHDGSTLTES